MFQKQRRRPGLPPRAPRSSSRHRATADRRGPGGSRERANLNLIARRRGCACPIKPTTQGSLDLDHLTGCYPRQSATSIGPERSAIEGVDLRGRRGTWADRRSIDDDPEGGDHIAGGEGAFEGDRGEPPTQPDFIDVGLPRVVLLRPCRYRHQVLPCARDASMTPSLTAYPSGENTGRSCPAMTTGDDTRRDRTVDDTTTRGPRSGSTTPSPAVDLGDDVWLIDTRMGGYDGITAGYLINGDRPCLVETGAATSAGDVVTSLEALGVGPQDLATIVVTHIHLDHAGGVGDLAAAFPRAEVVVHEAGARHLADPSRLMASAARVFGDVLDQLFGQLRPTDAARIRVLDGHGGVDLGGGRRLDSFDSPGHARHHVGLLDSLTGDLYTGDAAGVWTPETGDLRPATPPPEFDLVAALASLERMRERRPTRLLFSHFGPVTDVDTTLDRSVEELRLWVELVRDARGDGLDLDHAVARVRERTAERYALRSIPALEEKIEVLSSTEADVAGIWRWLDAQSVLESTTD